MTHATPPAAKPRFTLVTGVIGADTHIVGNRILTMALEEAGYRVISLGALTPAGDFIKAAIETAADAILISSLYGQGELDCRGFRDLCIEAGLDGILLYVGGNLVVGKQPWDEVEQRFLDMGFDRAFPPGTRVENALAALTADLDGRKTKASAGAHANAHTGADANADSAAGTNADSSADTNAGTHADMTAIADTPPNPDTEP